MIQKHIDSWSCILPMILIHFFADLASFHRRNNFWWSYYIFMADLSSFHGWDTHLMIQVYIFIADQHPSIDLDTNLMILIHFCGWSCILLSKTHFLMILIHFYGWSVVLPWMRHKFDDLNTFLWLILCPYSLLALMSIEHCCLTISMWMTIIINKKLP